ncbi:hypothetical protein QZH41_001530 [Actinostola sp. cb2023]|nr:hypothetical protein QZH41_001530 [Actinostola sp. cb2023]
MVVLLFMKKQFGVLLFFVVASFIVLHLLSNNEKHSPVHRLPAYGVKRQVKELSQFTSQRTDPTVSSSKVDTAFQHGTSIYLDNKYEVNNPVDTESLLDEEPTDFSLEDNEDDVNEIRVTKHDRGEQYVNNNKREVRHHSNTILPRRDQVLKRDMAFKERDQQVLRHDKVSPMRDKVQPSHDKKLTRRDKHRHTILAKHDKELSRRHQELSRRDKENLPRDRETRQRDKELRRRDKELPRRDITQLSSRDRQLPQHNKPPRLTSGIKQGASLVKSNIRKQKSTLYKSNELDAANISSHQQSFNCPYEGLNVEAQKPNMAQVQCTPYTRTKQVCDKAYEYMDPLDSQPVQCDDHSPDGPICVVKTPHRYSIDDKVHIECTSENCDDEVLVGCVDKRYGIIRGDKHWLTFDTVESLEANYRES